MKMQIRECYCHVVSDEGPSGQIWKRLCHTSYIEKVYHQCVSSYVLLTRPIVQISTHSLSNCKYKAFHQYASFDGPSNGWTLYNFCHIQGDHRYELVDSFFCHELHQCVFAIHFHHQIKKNKVYTYASTLYELSKYVYSDVSRI